MAMKIDTTQPLYSTREVARLLGVSLKTVQLWVDNGILDAWKTVGGHRRITFESVERLRNAGQSISSAQQPIHPKETFLARQPILDRRQRIVAYELLYRNEAADHAKITDHTEASARVISYAFSELGLGIALGRSDCYINVGQGLLFNDAIQLLPKDHTTLELIGLTKIDDSLIARCKELRGGGIKIALSNYTPVMDIQRLAAHIDVVKIALDQCDKGDIERAVQNIRAISHAQLLAEKVETIDQFQYCLDQGFDLFQGYYFARPHLVASKQASHSKSVLLHLVELVMGDASNVDIEEALKVDPGLCYSLFRLVNSVAMGINRRITTVHEVITILGRRQLQRWIFLLLFAQQEGYPYPSPLLQMAALRGKFMEKLAALEKPVQTHFHEQAFITGILSLTDVLFGIPAEEILNHIRAVEEVRDAILFRDGALGKMLTLCEMLESGEMNAIHTLIGEFNIEPSGIMQAQVEALQWANTIGDSIQ